MTDRLRRTNELTEQQTVINRLRRTVELTDQLTVMRANREVTIKDTSCSNLNSNDQVVFVAEKADGAVQGVACGAGARIGTGLFCSNLRRA